MKEISPKELQKLNDKSFKNTQKVFRRRLREIAAGGENIAKYKPDDYAYGDRVEDWLKSLGFTVKQVNPFWCEVTWPEEEDVIEKLRKEVYNIWSRRIPTKFTWGVRIEREEPGVWTRDVITHDYKCSKCGKHAEYISDYCPNCGKQMKPLEGIKYDS